MDTRSGGGGGLGRRRAHEPRRGHRGCYGDLDTDVSRLTAGGLIFPPSPAFYRVFFNYVSEQITHMVVVSLSLMFLL